MPFQFISHIGHLCMRNDPSNISSATHQQSNHCLNLTASGVVLDAMDMMHHCQKPL